MALPHNVKIVEVGPRDGLQNESKFVPTNVKIEFINRLSQSGLTVIEATSFVSPKWIPQLADHNEVFAGIKKNNNMSYPVLVPNEKGFENALLMDVKEIEVFTTPSEQFSKKNTNQTVAESLKKISHVITLAKKHHMKVRGYLSCVLGCPYEGEINPTVVTQMAKKLIEMGCYEISLGDTIGIGTINKTKKLFETILREIPTEKLAVHFHNTYGQALVNIYIALQYGIATIDASVTGLGGCPYAEGAAGNVATEEVIYMLDGMGIKTGINRQKLIEAGRFVREWL